MSDGRGVRCAGLLRAALFFALWVALIGGGHVMAGLAAAAAVTAASLRLLPPARHGLRLGAVPGYLVRFVGQSVVAGWDVARRAFDPALPIRPGFVRYPVGLRPGPARNVFTVATSLVPGTVPVAEDAESITYHCLDVGHPVAAQLAAEEALLARMLGHD